MNDNIENLHKFKMVFDKRMGDKPVGIRVPAEDYENYMKIPQDIRSKLMRDFIHKIGQEYAELQH